MKHVYLFQGYFETKVLNEIIFYQVIEKNGMLTISLICVTLMFTT